MSVSVTRESLSELRLFVKTQIALDVPYCLTLVGFFSYVSTLLTLECYAVTNITRPNYTVGLGADSTVRLSQQPLFLGKDSAPQSVYVGD